MTYARVLVEVEPYHLDRPFDYRVADDQQVRVGSRVEVEFGGRRLGGVVTALADEPSVPAGRVRPLRRVLGEHAWLTPADLELARWAGERFCAPTADVVRHQLPARVVDVEQRAAAAGWFPPGRAFDPPAVPAPGPDRPPPGWGPYGGTGRRLVGAARDGAGSFYWRPLPDEREGARLAELARTCVAAGRTALVVVPDPASAAAARLVDRLGEAAIDARGGLSARERYRAWLRARCGHGRVLVGGRGVSLWPLPDLGLAVVVDEANPALKEQRSPRHHAREVALERARRARGVGLLVGTVPSARAWRLLTDRRLTVVRAPRGPERARAPRVQAATAAGGPRTRLLPEAMAVLREALDADAYGVVVAARRGEGRRLVCGECGRRRVCPECGAGVDAGSEGTGSDRTGSDGNRSERNGSARDGSDGNGPAGAAVLCARCAWSRRRVPDCPDCGSRELVPLAAGTRRLADELGRSMDGPVAALEGHAAEAPAPPAVLVTTRGSVLDAPPGPVGAVVLPDVDTQVRRPRLDASEDALRLSMRAASWVVHPDGRVPDRPASRGEPPPAGGDPVVVQTREPDAPVVQALVAWDPGGFWRREAATRAELGFPPATTAVRIRADAEEADELDRALRGALPGADRVLGPAVRDGRAGWLIKAAERGPSLAAIAELRRQRSEAGSDPWVEVDPVGEL